MQANTRRTTRRSPAPLTAPTPVPTEQAPPGTRPSSRTRQRPAPVAKEHCKWTVTKAAGQRRRTASTCPKPPPGEPMPTCNPPPPMAYACPDGDDRNQTLTVVQLAAEHCQIEQTPPMKCPPKRDVQSAAAAQGRVPAVTSVARSRGVARADRRRVHVRRDHAAPRAVADPGRRAAGSDRGRARDRRRRARALADEPRGLRRGRRHAAARDRSRRSSASRARRDALELDILRVAVRVFCLGETVAVPLFSHLRERVHRAGRARRARSDPARRGPPPRLRLGPARLAARRTADRRRPGARRRPALPAMFARARGELRHRQRGGRRRRRRDDATPSARGASRRPATTPRSSPGPSSATTGRGSQRAAITIDRLHITLC